MTTEDTLGLKLVIIPIPFPLPERSTMTSRDFCYWLQGLFELQDPFELDSEQTEKIKNHLAMVFIHEIDPSFPAEQQDALNAVHQSLAPSGYPASSMMKC